MNREYLKKRMSIDETIQALEYFCDNVELTHPGLNEKLKITVANAANYLFMYKQAKWQRDAITEMIAKDKVA